MSAYSLEFGYQLNKGRIYNNSNNSIDGGDDDVIIIIIIIATTYIVPRHKTVSFKE